MGVVLDQLPRSGRRTFEPRALKASPAPRVKDGNLPLCYEQKMRDGAHFPTAICA